MKMVLPFIMAVLASPVLSAQQFLPMDGIVNARDLGGYTVLDGRQVRSGLLIRSAHLADAKESDLQYLGSLPTAKVIDFRTEREAAEKADKPVPGAVYLWIPLDVSGSVGATATEEEKKRFLGKKKLDVKKIILMAAFNDKAKKVAREMYPNLVFSPECQIQMAAFFRELVATESGAVLFHCTQGKDRTGIASALILAALGADRQTIIRDFDATNRVYEKDVRKYTRRVKFWGGKEEEIAVVKSFMGANTDNFIKTLDAIDQRYGSLDAYLKGPVGLTEEDINILRNRYLTQ